MMKEGTYPRPLSAQSTGSSSETLTWHFYQEENGQWFDLTDSNGSQLFDSSRGMFGVETYPAPLVANTSKFGQFFSIDPSTQEAIEETTRTILIGSRETVSTPLGAFVAVPVTTDSFSEDLGSFAFESTKTDETSWISAEHGIVKWHVRVRLYEFDSLEGTVTFDLEATSMNF